MDRLRGGERLQPMTEQDTAESDWRNEMGYRDAQRTETAASHMISASARLW